MKSITKENIGSARTIIHRCKNNADGTPVRARSNGRVKTWKTRPNDWVAPFKYGLKACFYIGLVYDGNHRVDQFPEDWAIPENGEEYRKR